jgi:hypothetical protein|tara:strand:+ start:574 stop:750 length:177 start_codon:yes stop_codon:yes gene_type:complete
MPGKWDGKSRPVNNAYRDNYDDIFKRKKKERGYKEASLSSFFDSCLSAEEKKKRKKNV